MSQVVLGVLKLGAMSTVPQVIVWTLPSEEFELTKMSWGVHDILSYLTRLLHCNIILRPHT